MDQPQRPVSQHTNSLGQPVGAPVPGWVARPRPSRSPMEGRLCRLEPLQASRHAAALHEAYSADRDGRNWTYLPYGPFASTEEYAAWVRSVERSEDPLFFAIVHLGSGRPAGVASYLRADPAMGCIEVGHLSYSPALQRTTAATEAMYLMMRRAFDELGYRRYEWKCNSLNAPSWNAAERLGFRYEGTFRQHWVQNGRNRDNAWFSILDGEWPTVRSALEAWLDPSNLGESGQQLRTLREFMREARA
ncbi:MAG: GNAT family protein [Dehalococcoidia bacterium]|nr:GNAT family protein [Dehalococcoidia bacterium]